MKYIQQGNSYNNTSMIINYIICVVFALFNYNYNKRLALLKWKRNSKHFFCFYLLKTLFICFWTFRFNSVFVIDSIWYYKQNVNLINKSIQDKRKKKPVVINLISFCSMILIVFKLMNFIEKFKYWNIWVQILN